MDVALVSYWSTFDPSLQKMVKHTLKKFQQMMQDFQAMFNHLEDTKHYRVN